MAVQEQENQQTQLLVDAACDVPQALLQTSSVCLMPTRVKADGQVRTDWHNTNETLDFYRLLDTLPPAAGGTEPLQVHEMETFIQARLQVHGGPVLALVVSGTRSGVPPRMQEAVARFAPPEDSPARVDMVDSGNLFAGFGVQLIDLVQQRQQGLGWGALVRLARRNVEHAHVLLVPSRLDFIAHGAPTTGDRSVGPLQRMALGLLNFTPVLHAHQGKTRRMGRRMGVGAAREAALGLASRLVRQSLLVSPHVLVSYSGPLAEVELMGGYQRLLTLARRYGVAVHLAPMAMTNAVHVGPRALSVGFLAAEGSVSGL